MCVAVSWWNAAVSDFFEKQLVYVRLNCRVIAPFLLQILHPTSGMILFQQGLIC